VLSDVSIALCIKTQRWPGLSAYLTLGSVRLLKFPGVEPNFLSLPARSAVVYLLMCGSQHMFVMGRVKSRVAKVHLLVRSKQA